MTADGSHPSGAQTPLDTFSNCHSGILRHMADLGDLPALLAPAQRARRIAAEALDFFRPVVFEHHREEEAELFPAVLKSAAPGDERTRVEAMIERLTQEHRTVEAAWKSLEPSLRQVAKGQDNWLDTVVLEQLVRQYSAHAVFEETEFLPLAQTILSRNSNHMEALGLALHMRHMPPPMRVHL